MSNPKFGSLEVFYTYLSDVDKAVELVTDIEGLKQFAVGPKIFQPVTVRVGSYEEGPSAKFIQVETLLGSTVIDRSDYFTFQFEETIFALRIFFFDQFISVSVNDCWVYSYALSEVQYPSDTPAALLKMDGATTTITDIRRVELSDGREAVFVDYESTTDNAIQSIIQQRPVQVIAHVDRKTSFTYYTEKDTIEAVWVSEYEEEIVRQSSLSSDGLVYAAEVAISIDEETARDVGFITRLYRLSELSTGYERAATFMQRQTRQRRKPKTVTMRLDPRVEISDVLHVDLTTTGTLRAIDKEIIVEDIGIGMRDGEYTMTVKGREKT